MISYIIFLLLFITGIIFLINADNKKRRKKRLADLKASWGKQKSEYFNFDLIDTYSRINHTACFHELDKQTMNDIDFYDLFSYVDRTVSKIGQQFLFDKLKKPTNDIDALKLLSGQADFFRANASCRMHTQALLSGLNKNEAYFISSLLKTNLIQKPGWINFLFLDLIATVALVILLPFYHPASLGLILLFALNLFLHFKNRNNTYEFANSIPQLNVLIDIAGKLCDVDIPFEKQQVKISIDRLATFKRKSSLLQLGRSTTDDLSQVLLMIWDLIKILLLVEVFAFHSLIRLLENRRTDILQLFRFIGDVDTAISIASLRTGTELSCTPEFTESKKELHIEKVYHPLVPGCIANSLNIVDNSILITGSNMSGKTTFLRTIAVNSILAQTIFTCFAEKFITPILKQYSSIRIDDNILEGKSYYLSEVETMKKLIDAVSTSCQHIFLLDEVFKGTNKTERVAASKAILSYLTQDQDIVIVATHDMELSQMLAGEYNLYHFEDSIVAGRLVFDHLLKKGPLKTRNAIAILELSGYPEKIIEDAKHTCTTLT